MMCREGAVGDARRTRGMAWGLFFVVALVFSPFMGGGAHAALQVRLKSIRVLGVPPGPLPEPVYRLLASYDNRYVGVPQLTALRDAVQRAYRRAGYFLSRATLVPGELDPNNAVLTFRIAGGHIGRISIRGDAAGSAFWQLKRYLLEIRRDYPVSVHHLEKNLLLLNELPGVKVKALMFPGKTLQAPDMSVTISTVHAGAFLGVANRVSASLGDYELQGGVSYYRLLGGDKISFLVYGDPAFKYNRGGNVIYDTTFGSFGTHVVLTYGMSQTRPTIPGVSIKEPLVKGMGQNADIHVTVPVVYTRNRFRVYSGVGYSYADSLDMHDAATRYKDVIAKLYLGLNFTQVFIWRLPYLRYGWIKGDIRGEQGLPVLGAESEPRLPSTPKGSGVFTKFFGKVTTIQYLSRYLHAGLGVAFQMSNTNLLASEKLAFGGDSFGRAYLPASYTGDSGLLGRGDVGYDVRVGLGMPRSSLIVTPFAFADGGVLSNIYHNIVSGKSATYSPIDVGVGLKLSTSHLSFGSFGASVEYGVPVGVTGEKSIFFNVIYQY